MSIAGLKKKKKKKKKGNLIHNVTHQSISPLFKLIFFIFVSNNENMANTTNGGWYGTSQQTVLLFRNDFYVVPMYTGRSVRQIPCQLHFTSLNLTE